MWQPRNPVCCRFVLSANSPQLALGGKSRHELPEDVGKDLNVRAVTSYMYVDSDKHPKLTKGINSKCIYFIRELL